MNIHILAKANMKNMYRNNIKVTTFFFNCIWSYHLLFCVKINLENGMLARLQ